MYVSIRSCEEVCRRREKERISETTASPKTGFAQSAQRVPQQLSSEIRWHHASSLVDKYGNDRCAVSSTTSFSFIFMGCIFSVLSASNQPRSVRYQQHLLKNQLQAQEGEFCCSTPQLKSCAAEEMPDAESNCKKMKRDKIYLLHGTMHRIEHQSDDSKPHESQ